MLTHLRELWRNIPTLTNKHHNKKQKEPEDATYIETELI